MAPFSPGVLSSWRVLARAARLAAGVAGAAAVFAGVDAATGAPALAVPVASAAAPTASTARPAATSRPKRSKALKTRRAKGSSARASRSKSATRAERRSARRAAARARRGRERAAARAAAPAPALHVPVVELPDVALATATPGDTSSWEAALAATTTSAAAVVPSTGAPPVAAAGAGPFAVLSRSATSLLDGLVTRARSQLGTRYVYGGAAPGAELDCSSFVRYVMEALNVRLPRTANQQARVGRPVPRDPSQLRPGDLLTFGRGRRTSHVGIYLGEGRFIHASVKSGQVIETTIERNRSLFRRWQGARRLFADADSLAGDAESGG
jgi:cell wall-associated NlpC family hydrolase